MLKRLFDLMIASVLFIIVMPIFIIVSFFIYIEDGGVIFFHQRRIGKSGKVFSLIKFRSMIDNAEKSGTGLYSYDGDPRITRVGKFIRKTSLDELPQLLNVICGEMSLVGPRPPVIYELGEWEDYTRDMLQRFIVKPGITGLAQVSGRNENDWDTKIELDNHYINLYQKYGILIDIKILLKTIVVVFSRKDTIEKTPPAVEGPVSRRARVAAERHINN